MIWACPICQADLIEVPSGLACAQGHSFDRARQGYINLLPAHHRRSAAPGDDASMLTRRHDFLAAGYYEPLLNSLQGQLARFVTASGRPAVLLDSGCGEGYYLRGLLQHADRTGAGGRVMGFGVDISKDAAKLASRGVPSGTIAVGSAFRLPVKSSSVDILLRVFAPGSWEEVARVLTAAGEVWLVTPGSDHMKEIKAYLYEQPKPHEAFEVPEGFTVIHSESVQFQLQLSSQISINQLLEMTPFAWCGDPQGKDRLSQLTQLDVTADFNLTLLRAVG